MTLIVENLRKSYGRNEAVRGISFRLEPGESLALLGPNGAGKTTTIKSILGLVIPDSGRISVDGLDCMKQVECRRLLGYAPETPDAPRWMTVCEFIEAMGALDSMPRSVARREGRKLLEALGVDSLCSRKFGELSKGQRKRVLLAHAFLPWKRYLLLDEPFTGLSPEWIDALRRLIASAVRSGKAVLISSHLLRELEGIVNKVVVIRKGSLLYEGPVSKRLEEIYRGIAVGEGIAAPA